jgi:hypothetical protein
VYKEALLEETRSEEHPHPSMTSTSTAVDTKDISVSAASTEGTFDSWPEMDKKIINLRRCWEVYALAKLSFENIEMDLASANVSTWMSGLACCTSQECLDSYALIMDITGPEMVIEYLYSSMIIFILFNLICHFNSQNNSRKKIWF